MIGITLIIMIISQIPLVILLAHLSNFLKDFWTITSILIAVTKSKTEKNIKKILRKIWFLQYFSLILQRNPKQMNCICNHIIPTQKETVCNIADFPPVKPLSLQGLQPIFNC